MYKFLRFLRYLLFFLACLVVALVFNLPVVQVLPWVKLPDTIQLAGVDGTILRGKAQQITLSDFPVRGVRYRYMPSCIALLKVCYRIEFDEGQFQVAYDLLNGDTEVAKARVEYPVSVLTPFLPPLLVQPVGKVELLVDELSLVEDKPAVLQGKLVWRDLGIADKGITMNIGDYQLEFSGKSPKYDLNLTDMNALLVVKGEGEINAGGIYSLNIKIEPRSEIEPQVKYILGVVAENISFNKYRIRYKGKLPPHIAQHL